MRVYTTVVPRIKARPPRKRYFLSVVCLVIEIVFNRIFPFILGAYFILTGSLIFYGLFLLMLFFDLRLDVKYELVEIQLIRRL